MKYETQSQTEVKLYAANGSKIICGKPLLPSMSFIIIFLNIFFFKLGVRFKS
ncbi:uncharacterized protein DS421_10g312150 [Arachis hypogaea]|nr:uncharacterized protein DS421_10g312150 [Arachis hypogaea]